MRFALKDMLLAFALIGVGTLVTMSFGWLGFAFSMLNFFMIAFAKYLAIHDRPRESSAILGTYLSVWAATAVFGTIQVNGLVSERFGELPKSRAIAPVTRHLYAPEPPWASRLTLAPCPFVTLTEYGSLEVEPRRNQLHGTGHRLCHFWYFGHVRNIYETALWQEYANPYVDLYSQ